MKKLILDVSCVNELASDVPQHFVVELSDAQIKRIKELAQNVKNLNVSLISEYDYSGDYVGFSKELDDIHSLSAEDMAEALLTAAPDIANSMECQSLTVCEDTFFFSALPKHCNDAFRCESRSVAIEELDKPDAYLAFDY